MEMFRHVCVRAWGGSEEAEQAGDIYVFYSGEGGGVKSPDPWLACLWLEVTGKATMGVCVEIFWEMFCDVVPYLCVALGLAPFYPF